jgi:hypothetical protein
MARRPRRPLFLGRDTYRLRRWRDAGRLLPLVGAILWMLPLMWPRGGTGNALALTYIFLVWVGLVVAAQVIAPRAARAGDPEDTDRAEDPPE